MPLKSIIICDVCENEMIEHTPGSGFPGWGSLQGVVLDDVDSPALCPDHLEEIAEFLDQMKNSRENT